MKLIKQVSDKYEIDRDEVYGRHHTAHLIHTGHILKKAGCDSEVVNAGILHSIYDADSMYGNEGVPISERSTIALMTNPQTEKLIYKYSIAHVADNYENILVSEHAEDPYSARALADILICDMIEQIIWCVEKKNLFTYAEALEHLNKLQPAATYASDSVRKIFDLYVSKCI